jgi:type VI secretion system FHA domain protein
VALVLEVTSSQSPTPSSSRQTFGTSGGSIGREPHNSLVLPQSKVSGRHAEIGYANGTYYITDRSRNGTYLNSSRNRLTRDQPHPLKAGDRILIEDYEITVALTRDDARGAEPSLDPFAGFDQYDPLAPGGDDPFAPQPEQISGYDPHDEPASADELDPLALLNLSDNRPPPRQKAPTADDLEMASPLENHFRPPPVGPAPKSPRPIDPLAIPEDYDPLAPDIPAPPPRPMAPPPVDRAPFVPDPDHAAQRPRIKVPKPPVSEVAPPPPPPPPIAAVAPPPPSPPPQRVPATPAASPPLAPAARVQPPPLDEHAVDVPPTFDLRKVLEGAGLNPADITPELASTFGRIIRVVVSGVMDVLQSRQQIKDEFRMQMTRFRPRENNPLKFSANVEDALHNLLVKRNEAYLGPVEAFEDAFTDLRNHQLAMLAGMRVAFQSMLAEFDPDTLQEEFDRRNKGLVPAKMRYWELFREKRNEIVKDPEASFRRLFGEEFARAYEQQLTQLKNQASRAGASSARPKPSSDS